jgi:N-formylglutamate amidohydrolase
MEAPALTRFGPDVPQSPVVVSVPHAGRAYPPAMAALVSIPLARLTMLEDRCVDALAHAAVTTATLLVADIPRAWIDLNRSPATDRDPQVDAGAMPTGSDKVRSGIGLIPRRAGGADNMWRRKLTEAEVADRIARVHAPYHAAVAAALAAAHARFGVAMLVDLHSMPPLTGFDAPQVVLGDRFGRSGPGQFTARAAAIVRAHGLTVAVNHPYAGGHILAAHARPRHGVHALQVEIDRSLYLDAALDRPGPGLPRIAAMLRAMIDALAEAALGHPLPVAAE